MNEIQNFRLHRNRLLTLGVIFSGMLLPSVASATLYSGTFNGIGKASVSLNTIAFTNSPIFAVSTDDFLAAGLDGTTGTITNISNPPYSVNTYLATPNFITFTALPGVSFTLTTVLAGSFGDSGCAIDGPCSPTGSPYNLHNETSVNGTNAIASFTVIGFETDGTTSRPFTGTFSSTFANKTYQSLLADIGAGKTINTTYSASFFVSPVPEPAFLLIPVGLGLAVMLGRNRRKFQV